MRIKLFGYIYLLLCELTDLFKRNPVESRLFGFFLSVLGALLITAAIISIPPMGIGVVIAGLALIAAGIMVESHAVCGGRFNNKNFHYALLAWLPIPGLVHAVDRIFGFVADILYFVSTALSWVVLGLSGNRNLLHETVYPTTKLQDIAMYRNPDTHHWTEQDFKDYYLDHDWYERRFEKLDSDRDIFYALGSLFITAISSVSQNLFTKPTVSVLQCTGSTKPKSSDDLPHSPDDSEALDPSRSVRETEAATEKPEPGR